MIDNWYTINKNNILKKSIHLLFLVPPLFSYENKIMFNFLFLFSFYFSKIRIKSHFHFHNSIP